MVIKNVVEAKMQARIASLSQRHDLNQDDRPVYSRIELDSHANMICLGNNCTVIRRTGLTMRVNAFANEAGGLNDVPLVDAVVLYHDEFEDKEYLLVFYNALYIPSMDHHLVPPFIMREAGLRVDETPKIQSSDPGEDTHVVYDPKTGLRIHLGLHGIFSCFECRALTDQEMIDWKEFPVIYAAPCGRTWDPYDPMYAEEERGFLDSHGNVIDERLPETKKYHLIDDDEDWRDLGRVSSTFSEPCSLEQYQDCINKTFETASVMLMEHDDDAEIDAMHRRSMACEDAGTRCIASIDSNLVEENLADALEERALLSGYGIAAGSISSLNMDPKEDELFTEQLGATISQATATFAALASGKPNGVSPEVLAKLWTISHDEAQKTLDNTTQMGRQDANTSLAREFPTNDRAVRYNRLVDTVFFMDTMMVTAKAKSTRGYTCCQVFVSDKGFVWIHLMKSVSGGEILLAMQAFAKEVGVPWALICDPHPSQKTEDLRRFLYEIGTSLRLLERGTQWANLAERFIGLLKNGVRKDLRESNAPMILWDYCLERRMQIMNLTARNTHKLAGSNPYSVTFGGQADISNLVQYGWFEWVYYLEDRNQSVHKFPRAIQKLGRCLGPSKEGNEMAQSVLTQKGTIVTRRSLRKLTPFELSVTNEDEKFKRQCFLQEIRQKLGDPCTLPSGELTLPTIEEESTAELYEMWLQDPNDLSNFVEEGDIDLEELAHEVKQGWVPEADIVDSRGTPITPLSMGDMMIGIEVLLPSGEESQTLCKVIRRSVDQEGKTTGVYDNDPALSTMIYDVKFPDGAVKQYGANVIAQNVLEQVEDDGHFTVKLKQIVDHRREGNAVSKEQRYITMRDGQRKLRQSTVGWKFLVEFTDGKKQWIALKDLKESNPVDAAEYVAARKLDDEVAFAWWVPYTLRKKDTIIAAVRGRSKRKTHKYGIEVPDSVEHALRLDRENGNTYWQCALQDEMGQIGVAIQILDDAETLPPGYARSTGHIIFDVKMDFRRKARWVLDGHRQPAPETSNYAGVVSRESVRIAFTYAAMLDLPVMAGDIRNAYLQAPASGKNFINCGPEFGDDNAGKRAIIKRSIYGGKTAGRDFWLHLRTCMSELGFESSKGDPDVWFRPAVRKNGSHAGEEYMEYVLLYVDDVLVVSENAEAVLRQEIGKHWDLKEGSIGKPSLYLGGKCREVELSNGRKAWAFGSSQYVQAAVKNVEEYLEKSNRKLPRKAEAPFKSGYRPEIDVSRELIDQDASYYQSLIGVLRWMVELGRVDICLEVSLMSSHLALPREGHLEALFHTFAYLKKYHNTEMVYDPSVPEIDPGAFGQQDWTYSTMRDTDTKEVLPPNMPHPRGRGFVIRCYVDADHAGDEITRRSRTGFIVYLNNAPVYWYSKRQGSVESSTYQAEFTAMKEACEYVRSLRYKLRMMGIPVDEATYIFGDNRSVLANTTNPGSTLKKKCAAIAYHLVREGVARKEWITAWISTHDNIADLLTKPMAAGEKRNGFVRQILQHIFRKD